MLADPESAQAFPDRLPERSRIPRADPSTQEQWAMYNQMTPYKLERNTFNGKTLYTYADKQNGVVSISEEIKRMNATKNLESSSRSLKKELEAS